MPETKKSFVHDENIEKICLNLLLQDNSLIAKMPLRESHFYTQENKEIFKIIEGYISSGKTINLALLSGELKLKGISILNMILDDQPLSIHSEEYFAVITRLTDRRKTAKILEDSLTKNATAGQVLDDLRTVSLEDPLKTEFGDSLINSFLSDLEGRKDNPVTIPTGFKMLDSCVLLERGWLVTLAARSSVGKSTIAMNMAIHQARQGLKVIIFTQEMTAIEYLRRIFSYISKKNTYVWKNGLIDEENKTITLEQYDKIKNNLIFVHDGNMNSNHVVDIVRSQKPDVVIVDYLQSLGDKREKGETQSALVGSITKKLKILAVQMKCVVIQLSQVNRDANNQVNSMPELHHLRDSGNIEQDSDVVLILNRESLEEKEGVLKIAKNRHGKITTVPLGFIGSVFEFYESQEIGK